MTMLHRTRLLMSVLLIGSAGAGTAAQAQTANVPRSLPSSREITADLAIEAATQAERACAADGYVVSVSVVDRDGVYKALVVGDGSSSLKTEASRRKAYTAAIFGQATSQLATTMPDARQVLGPLDGTLLIQAGGLPLRIGGDLIGAIGVAGAPGGDKDEACASAGIERVRLEFR